MSSLKLVLMILTASLLGACKNGSYELHNPWDTRLVAVPTPAKAPVPVVKQTVAATPKPIVTEDSTIYPQPSAFSKGPVPLALSAPADTVALASSAGQGANARVSSAKPPELDLVGNVRNGAARTLAAKALRARDAGNLAQATALYERALKIDAFDPWLLHSLAVLKARQGHLSRARSLAARAQVMNYDGQQLSAVNVQLLLEILQGLAQPSR